MEYNPNKLYEHFSHPLSNHDTMNKGFTPAMSNIPWNISLMPWSAPNPCQGVMEFKGTPNVKPPDLSKVNLHSKRKSDLDSYIPTKHLITEEKMVAHMNGLHISGDYTSHQGNELQEYNARVIMTQEELERKLKNAQSITVCEEVRKLSNDPIIPKVLMERMEKPCTALVVWQPPQKIQNIYNNIVQNHQNLNSDNNKKLFSDFIQRKQQNNRNVNEDDELFDEHNEIDNNNSSSVDLNNCMDLDI